MSDNVWNAWHHGRARDLAEGADVRQARGAVARFEQHIALFRQLAAELLQQLAGLGEGPGVGVFGDLAQIGHVSILGSGNGAGT
jgi:hypothetical protein